MRIKSLKGNKLSHHNLGAFFSGIDINDLKSATDTNNFIFSITVDNFQKYVGKIAYKVKGIATPTLKGIDNTGKEFTFTSKEISFEEVIIHDCTFEFEDEVLTLDEEFLGFVERIIKEASTKTTVYKNAYTPPKTFNSFQKQQSFDFTKDENDFSIEEEFIFQILTGRVPTGIETLYKAIEEVTRWNMKNPDKVQKILLHLNETLPYYAHTKQEKKEFLKSINKELEKLTNFYQYRVDIKSWLAILKNSITNISK